MRPCKILYDLSPLAIVSIQRHVQKPNWSLSCKNIFHANWSKWVNIWKTYSYPMNSFSDCNLCKLLPRVKNRKRQGHPVADSNIHTYITWEPVPSFRTHSVKCFSRASSSIFTGHSSIRLTAHRSYTRMSSLITIVVYNNSGICYSRNKEHKYYLHMCV